MQLGQVVEQLDVVALVGQLTRLLRKQILLSRQIKLFTQVFLRLLLEQAVTVGSMQPQMPRRVQRLRVY